MNPNPARPVRTGHFLVATAIASLVAVSGFSPFGDTDPAGALTSNGRIAFASDQDGDVDIYTARSDGSSRTNLTAGSTATDTQPTWSPDGTRIAFTSDRDGDRDLYVMDADGAHLQQVTNVAGVDARPSWSPDGKRLAFRSDRSGSQQVHVARMDLIGNPVSQLTSGPGLNTEPSWGPSGRIAFTSTRDGDRELFVMDTLGQNQTKVTNNGADDGNARWVSPTRLVFQSKVGGDFEVAEIDADGTHRVALTDTPANEATPVRSPDHTKLLYSVSQGDGRDIRVAGASGSPSTTVISDAAVNEFPDWQFKNLVIQPVEQVISEVSVDTFGTKATVHFTTKVATNDARVELWAGNTFHWKFDQGALVKRHHLTVDFLKPATSYTVKVFAPKFQGGDATYTRSQPVKTLTRKVTVLFTDAHVYNDADEDSCGDIRLFGNLDYETFGGMGTYREACDGAWNFADFAIVRTGGQDDDMVVNAEAWEDDSVLCGIVDDCLDLAEGSTSVTLVNDTETFTSTGSVHLHPTDGLLNLVAHFTYTVSYHA